MAFNWFGYQGLSCYLQHRADQSLQTLIDNGNYNNQALIELSVAVNLPYATDMLGWEKFEGEIEIDGVHYRCVQRKLENGRMYVRCLPNAEKQNVLNARDAYFKLAYSINQHAQNKQGSGTIYISNYIGDYDDQCSHPCSIAAWTPLLPAHAVCNACALPEPPLRQMIKPPAVIPC
jgi:hypothetical protein